MCNHDWEEYSSTADGTGDLYVYSICIYCEETKEEVVDQLRY